jgi:hypothetical protein
MRDYFSAAAGLSAGTTYASTILSTGDPLTASLSALTAQPSHALLGAFFDALVAHDWGTDEMQQLNKALDLWTTLTTLIGQLRQARASLEAGVANPTDSDTAIAAIAAAAGARDRILPQIQDWTKQAGDFVQDPSLLKYLPTCGEATDSDPKTWQWPELVMTRRTGALRRELLKSSTGTAATALALGAVSGYATQLTMGSWRNAVVGGPPRNHPLRSRLVARTAGAWLRANSPALTPSLSELLTKLQTGIGPTLPSALTAQMDKAMNTAYGQFLPAKAPPDFKKAYRSLLRHLEILDQLRFWIDVPLGQPSVPVIPAPKPPPIQVLVQASAVGGTSGGGGGGGGGGASGQSGTIKIQSGGQAGANVAAKNYTGKSGAEWWKIVLAVFVTILLVALLGIVGAIVGALGGPPGIATGAVAGGSIGLGLGVAFGEAIGAWEDNSHDTLAQAQQALSSPDGAVICKALFDLDIALYSAASQFLTLLKGIGLAYPETPDLTTPPFKELLTVQSLEIHRAMPTPESFAAYPTSPVELATSPPQTPGWPYGPGALPGSAIDQSPVQLTSVTAASLSMVLWRDCFNGEDVLGHENHNLESDRGFMMAAWKGATKPQPISINLLPYGAI